MVAFSINAIGIKCDATGCGYHDNTADLSNPRDWLNKPCPLCGAPLLTQADLETMEALSKGIAFMNELFGAILPPELIEKIEAKAAENKPVRTHRLELRGDGSVTIHPPRDADSEGPV